MTIALACLAGFVTFCVLILIIEYGDHWIAKLPGEREMPTPEQPRPTQRFVATLPGDSFADGVRRAFILSSEYDSICLVHLGTPVMVTWDSDPYSVESEWTATRNIQKARAICNGK